VLGIRTIMFVHHLLRYGFATVSGVEGKVRKQVSGACMRELLFGNVPLNA
jgi:hypothetical protein